MSANLIEEKRLAIPAWLRLPQAVVNRQQRPERLRRDSIPPVTDDEEITFITRAVIWMVVLGMTPLILFHVITFFYPDMFMIPVAPN